MVIPEDLYGGMMVVFLLSDTESKVYWLLVSCVCKVHLGYNYELNSN